MALCTSGFIITIINKGYDILSALYWQVLDSFPFIEHHYSNWKEAVAALQLPQKRDLGLMIHHRCFLHSSLKEPLRLSGSKEVVTTIIWTNRNQVTEYNSAGTEAGDLQKILIMECTCCIVGTNFQFCIALTTSSPHSINSRAACSNSILTYLKKSLRPALVKMNLKQNEDIYLYDRLNRAAVVCCLLEFE